MIEYDILVTRSGLALVLSLVLCLTGCAASRGKPKDALQAPPAGGEAGAQEPALDEETGSCRPLLRYLTVEFDEDKDVRHSCWNRVWEVPAAIVLYPTAAVILAGAVTSPIWVPLIFVF